MTTLSNSMLVSSPGNHLKSVDQRLGSLVPINISFRIDGIGKTQLSTSKRALTIQAANRGDEVSGSSSNFLGGFFLGGLIAGALGFAFAPQISKALTRADKKVSEALAGADTKNIMNKLPDFIYNEEKALEKTRQRLAKKIEQLNSAIDGVSAQLKSEDAPNEEVAINGEEEEELDVAL